jgi:hypothetical protein
VFDGRSESTFNTGAAAQFRSTEKIRADVARSSLVPLFEASGDEYRLHSLRISFGLSDAGDQVEVLQEKFNSTAGSGGFHDLPGVFRATAETENPIHEGHIRENLGEIGRRGRCRGSRSNG